MHAMSAIKANPREPTPGAAGLRFRAILLATDCSASGITTAKLAVHLAKESHAKLYVLHASLPELFGISTAGPIPELAVMQFDNARQALHKYIEHISDLRTIKHEEISFLGAATDAIRSTVESKSIDLLVLGSHARGGVAKIALGSVAEWASQHITCPVLVAGPRCTRAFHPFKSILFASELSTRSHRAARYAFRMAEQYSARLTVLHVRPSGKDQGEGSRSEAMTGLRRLIPAHRNAWCTLKYQVIDGAIPASVLQAAQESRANLIVLGSQRKPPLADHLPHAKLTAIIRGSRCPVLVVPQQGS